MSDTHTHTSEQDELISRPNHLNFRLVNAEIDAYAGLEFSDKSLVIAFPDNEKIIELAGDQGVGKTSLMRGMLALMGQQEPDNAVNESAKSKGASLTFEYEGETYQSRLTTTTFTLKNIKGGPGKKPQTSTVNKPKDVLSSIIGPIGISPDFLQKKKSGEAQIEWIKSMAASNPELAQREEELNKVYGEAYRRRTLVNAEVNNLRRSVTDTELYQWDDENYVLIPTEMFRWVLKAVTDAPANKEEVQEVFNAASKKKEELAKGERSLEQLNFQQDADAREIAAITAQIEKLLLTKQGIEASMTKRAEDIERGKSWVEERANANEEFAAAQQAIFEYSTIEKNKSMLEVVSGLVKKYGHAEEDQKGLNIILEETTQQLRDLAKEFTPDIEGLEVIVGNIDSLKPSGVYYKGINIAHLCESELWDFCLQVWKYLGIKIVFIENSSSLGSDAIARINWFAQNGGYVFMTTMQRGYKSLSVSFHEQVK